MKDGRAFLVTPGGKRVAHMTRARARGIAAALNTPEGGSAFMVARSESGDHVNNEGIYAGVKFLSLTDQEKRDLDETRRLAYIAYASLGAPQPVVSPEVAGTLVHAVQHHSRYFLNGTEWALEFAATLAFPIGSAVRERCRTMLLAIVDECTERLDEA